MAQNPEVATSTAPRSDPAHYSQPKYLFGWFAWPKDQLFNFFIILVDTRHELQRTGIASFGGGVGSVRRSPHMDASPQQSLPAASREAECLWGARGGAAGTGEPPAQDVTSCKWLCCEDEGHLTSVHLLKNVDFPLLVSKGTCHYRTMFFWFCFKANGDKGPFKRSRQKPPSVLARATPQAEGSL